MPFFVALPGFRGITKGEGQLRGASPIPHTQKWEGEQTMGRGKGEEEREEKEVERKQKKRREKEGK